VDIEGVFISSHRVTFSWLCSVLLYDACYFFGTVSPPPCEEEAGLVAFFFVSFLSCAPVSDAFGFPFSGSGNKRISSYRVFLSVVV